MARRTKQYSKDNRYHVKEYLNDIYGRLLPSSRNKYREDTLFRVEGSDQEFYYPLQIIINKDIAGRYNFKKCLNKLEFPRLPEQGLEGRFDSLEERLNFLEDLLYFTFSGIITSEYISEDEADKLVRNICDEMYVNLDESIAETEDELNGKLNKIITYILTASTCVGIGINSLYLLSKLFKKGR